MRRNPAPGIKQVSWGRMSAVNDLPSAGDVFIGFLCSFLELPGKLRGFKLSA